MQNLLRFNLFLLPLNYQFTSNSKLSFVHIYYCIFYHLWHFSFYHLLTILTFLLHHLLELAIWDHLLPFIPFLTNGVFHLLPLAYIPFITGATWRFR